MWTGILAVPIIPFSLLAFVSSSISSAIRTDITTANELVVKLRAELGTPAAPTGGTPEKPELPKGLNEGDVITQLQLYASTIRAIDARARQLNWFVFHVERDPFAELRWNPTQSETENKNNQQILKDDFQLPVGLPNMPKALDKLTTTYQDVRSPKTFSILSPFATVRLPRACSQFCMLCWAPAPISCAASTRN